MDETIELTLLYCIGNYTLNLGAVMILRKCKMFCLLSILFLLSGCAEMHPLRPSSHFDVKAPSVRQAALRKIVFWRMDGAFSIQQETENHADIADFTWKQLSQKAYRIDILSALGLYSASIQHQLGIVKLWKNGTHVSTAKTPEKLMQKALGWYLPISPLSSWIKGIPAKNGGYYEAHYDYYGHLILLRQAGWVVSFQDYKKNKEAPVDFPQLIIMDGHGLRVKIVIKDWLLFTQRHPIPDAIA